MWWIERTDETEDDVDLRPRRPAEERRKERGVSGAGDMETRCRLEDDRRGGVV